jgi:hypothetical protein
VKTGEDGEVKTEVKTGTHHFVTEGVGGRRESYGFDAAGRLKCGISSDGPRGKGGYGEPEGPSEAITTRSVREG